MSDVSALKGDDASSSMQWIETLCVCLPWFPREKEVQKKILTLIYWFWYISNTCRGHVGQCFHDLGFSAFFGFWCSILETLIISLFYLFIFTVHASYHIFLFLMDHWLDVVTYKMARFLIHQSQVNFFVVLWSCFHQIKKVFWKDFFYKFTIHYKCFFNNHR